MNKLDPSLLTETSVSSSIASPPTRKKMLDKASLEEVARELGLDIHHGMCKCPFHPDNNPSLSVDFKKDAFKCFGCDAQGGPVSLVMKAKNCDKKEAGRWMNEHFPQTSHHTPPLPPHTTTYDHTTPLSSEDVQKKRLLLQEKRPIYAQLKYGIHNGVFYFGTTIGEQGHPAVVTSNRELFINNRTGEEGYDEIRSRFCLRYRFDFQEEILDAHFSVEGIARYLDGGVVLSIKDAFEKIKALNKRYMWYEDEESHDYVALDVISTYFMPVWEAKGRTFLEAERGSGKTRQCTIYKLLSCNSLMSPDTTGPAFFRVMESTVGTLIIDDCDSIGDEQKKSVLQHYKTGYKNTSKSIRTGDDKKKRRVESFRSYGHVVMNNTEGLDPISSDRTVFLPIVKSDKAFLSSLLVESAPEWQELRDDLFILALSRWEEVREAYAGGSSERLRARQYEINRPILVLAGLVGGDLRDRLEEWLLSSYENRERSSDVDDELHTVLSYFVGKMVPHKEMPKSIAEQVGKYLGLEKDDRQYKKMLQGLSIRIGRSLRRFPHIFRFTVLRGNNQIVFFSEDRLRDYFKMKGWTWCNVVESGGENGGKSGDLTPVEHSKGTCSYCGRMRSLEWKDQAGNRMCDECKRDEEART